jgi:hypothetical protein
MDGILFVLRTLPVEEDAFQRIWLWLYIAQTVRGMDHDGSNPETVGQIIEDI